MNELQSPSDGSKGVTVVLIGILRGSHQTGEEAMETIRAATRSVVRHDALIGRDAAVAAEGAVQGAIQVAREGGMDTAIAASAAAQSAIDTAEEIDTVVAEKVRNALRGTIDGVRVILKRPFARQSANYLRRSRTPLPLGGFARMTAAECRA